MDTGGAALRKVSPCVGRRRSFKTMGQVITMMHLFVLVPNLCGSLSQAPNVPQCPIHDSSCNAHERSAHRRSSSYVARSPHKQISCLGRSASTMLPLLALSEQVLHRAMDDLQRPARRLLKLLHRLLITLLLLHIRHLKAPVEVVLHGF